MLNLVLVILLRIFNRPETAGDILVDFAYSFISAIYFVSDGLLSIQPCKVFSDKWTNSVPGIFCENNFSVLPLGSLGALLLASMVILSLFVISNRSLVF